MSAPADPPDTAATGPGRDGEPSAALDDADGPGERAAADDVPGRLLFRYVTVEEWRDYRAIMGVFAGTSFAEFTPDDVAQRLAESDHPGLEVAVVADRLERLRAWGNLTVSSSVGNPSSLADYYRRRNRYLITPAAQEVHDVVEGVLSRVDDVRDVSTGRLGAIRVALEQLRSLDPTTADPEALRDAVRSVFDPMTAFSTEVTQFFAAINEWQSRYDLDEHEFRLFAEVLVGYVAERLDEIEQLSRPIGHLLSDLEPVVPQIVARVGRGLADRVERAGLADAVSTGHLPGSSIQDWEHLAAWFVQQRGRPPRLVRLRRDAVSAIRTLTQNLTRLSREGVGAASRRADFLRLARFFDQAAADGPDHVHRVAAAALGMYPSSHYGIAAADVDDPVSPATSWWEAPGATVPISLRERGDRANRGTASPVRDRSTERKLLLRRREEEQRARQRVDAELLSLGVLDGAELSAPAFSRLQQLVSAATFALGPTAANRVGHTQVDALACTVRRVPGAAVSVSSPDGTLTFHDLHITLEPGAGDGAELHQVGVPHG